MMTVTLIVTNAKAKSKTTTMIMIMFMATTTTVTDYLITGNLKSIMTTSSYLEYEFIDAVF